MGTGPQSHGRNSPQDGSFEENLCFCGLLATVAGAPVSPCGWAGFSTEARAIHSVPGKSNTFSCCINAQARDKARVVSLLVFLEYCMHCSQEPINSLMGWPVHMENSGLEIPTKVIVQVHPFLGLFFPPPPNFLFLPLQWFPSGPISGEAVPIFLITSERAIHARAKTPQ